VGRGYYNRPRLTAEKFIPDPFSQDPETRLYKTGDLARFLPDGTVEFLARIDHQVKIRGFRIELGEIEAALGAYPAVRECVVMAREDSPGNKRLVAYLVFHEGQSPSTNELRQYLKEKLPEFMTPSLFVPLEEMPLTPNGKINRRLLPAPEGDRPDLEVTYLAPQTEIERTIAAIWAEVLQVKRVGVHDNFFDLGGHSLLVAQVRNKLRDALGQDVPLVAFFESPTVQSLAHLLAQSGEQEESASQAIQERVSRQKEAFQKQKQLARTRRVLDE
jgi:acyl carrier protein